MARFSWISSVICLTCLMCLQPVVARDIGFGKLSGVKVYGFSNDKSVALYFEPTATHLNPDCDRKATFSYSEHSVEEINRFLSIAMAAYLSGKKVRVHSQSANCEGHFIALQDSYF